MFFLFLLLTIFSFDFLKSDFLQLWLGSGHFAFPLDPSTLLSVGVSVSAVSTRAIYASKFVPGNSGFLFCFVFASNPIQDGNNPMRTVKRGEDSFSIL